MQLLTLPPFISYSPLVIPLTHDRTRVNLTLARRDLFDARFQLISLEDRDNTESEAVNFAQNAGELDRTSEGRALEFLDAPSDLVPGVYEGGLKTWECASDLVDCLDGILGSESLGRLRGKKVLELGCGTAIPSLYIVQQLFLEPPGESAESRQQDEVHVHMQDYNALVLRLVTLPNIILTWYTHLKQE